MPVDVFYCTTCSPIQVLALDVEDCLDHFDGTDTHTKAAGDIKTVTVAEDPLSAVVIGSRRPHSQSRSVLAALPCLTVTGDQRRPLTLR